MADTAAEPETTIVPFSKWDDCASDCGPLYDANGACVPPVGPAGDEATYEKCFCDDSNVAGFKTGIKGVCDEICPDGDSEKTLVQIQNWFADMCGVDKVKAENGDSNDSGSGSSGTKAQNRGGGQSWVEMHWRWLIMIIVLVVAILAIWVLAFWWRRRYQRKKELQQSLNKNPVRDSWGPGAAPPEAGVFVESGSSASGFGGAPEKPAKKWFGGRG